MRMRKQATNSEKISAEDSSDRGLLPSIHKEFLKFNNKKTNQLINLNRYIKEVIYVANNHRQRCSTSDVIGEK